MVWLGNVFRSLINTRSPADPLSIYFSCRRWLIRSINLAHGDSQPASQSHKHMIRSKRRYDPYTYYFEHRVRCESIDSRCLLLENKRKLLLRSGKKPSARISRSLTGMIHRYYFGEQFKTAWGFVHCWQRDVNTSAIHFQCLFGRTPSGKETMSFLNLMDSLQTQLRSPLNLTKWINFPLPVLVSALLAQATLQYFTHPVAFVAPTSASRQLYFLRRKQEVCAWINDIPGI